MIINFIVRVLGFSKAISFSDKGVVVTSFNGRLTIIEIDALLDFPRLEKTLFGLKCILVLDEEIVEFKVQQQSISETKRDSFNIKLGHTIQAKVQSAIQTYMDFAQNCYLRDSHIFTLDQELRPVLKRYSFLKEQWSKWMDQNLILQVNAINKVYPTSENKTAIRNEFETRKLEARQLFLNQVELNPLTEQQALAVIRNNDRNLVLAAAGTGKTAVMVAKTLNLIDSKEASGNDILVLAYNKAAAEELKQRLYKRAKSLGLPLESCPEIQTFHALGRNILKASGADFHISELADDDIKLKMWVTEWLEQYVNTSSGKLKQLIDLSSHPSNPFDISSDEEYQSYIQTEKRTLNGELVKGFQELLIANWLYMNGVPYEYEAPYVSKRRIEAGIEYRPDFHIKGTSIYLEHFGIDRKGNTQKGINDTA